MFGTAKRPTIDYYNRAEYISVNRRIYVHLEGMIPATTKKLLDMPNCAATVPQFSFCSVGWKAKKDIIANNKERGLKYERWHDDLVNIN